MPLRLSGAYRSYAGSELFSLNYIRYNMYKKNCSWSPHQLCKKRVIIVFNVHIVIIMQKRHCSFGKVAFFNVQLCQIFNTFGAKYGISEIIGINLSVVNIF